MSSTPLITIVLPVYNGSHYIANALDAILAQTYTNFEVVVVNDCSTDATPHILAEYAAQDSRIRIIHNKTNLKLPASLNVGHWAGQGTIFTWTSDDNIPHPDWLETLLAALLHSEADIVYGPYSIIDASGTSTGLTSKPSSPRQLLWQNTVGASFLYKREVAEALRGYDTTLFLLEDYDFWVRAYLHGFKFVQIDACVYDYRRHDSSLSATLPQQTISIAYRAKIRKMFVSASSDEIFKSRTTLLYNGFNSLPKKVLCMLFWEALIANPKNMLSCISAQTAQYIRHFFRIDKSAN